ncbi:hypothetical protein [Granulicella sp. L60]|uniref:hypothetical protein n=1 Tax=Granulicella sp. L60 TaxID=1641866 RepID=UPI00131E27D7|nr:hypothetical protein [Granulicella sp. L60]
MSIEQISAVENLIQIGFTPREADFLYLVGTHSGVFTARQYRTFGGLATRGGTQQQLLDKLDKYQFIIRIALTQQHQIIHLSHKAFYRAILTEDSRLRRGMSASLMRQRLHYMDYIALNPDARYLTTEAQKIEYLTQQFGLSDAILPRQVYRAKDAANGSSVRFFPERYPMFITEAEGYAGLGIVYGEDPANRFASFRRFVLANRDLFSQIPSLNFTYVSTSSGRASLACALLRSLFGGPDSVHNEDMKHYFRLRQMYENNALGSFTDADYAFWTRNHKQYSALNYEPLFAEFCGQTSLSDSSLVVKKRMFSFCHFIPSTTLREGFEAER